MNSRWVGDFWVKPGIVAESWLPGITVRATGNKKIWDTAYWTMDVRGLLIPAAAAARQVTQQC